MSHAPKTAVRKLDDALARAWIALRKLATEPHARESVRELERALESASAATRSLRETPEPGARKPRVLVVDDDSWVADAIALELAEDMDVAIALGGREALAVLRKDPDFDLVLCDIMMPDVSGVDLYEALERERSPVIDRFVFITGGVLTPRTRIFLDRCQHPLLLKPFEPGSLSSTVLEHARKV